VGCGTGFFTIPAAQLIGDQGYRYPTNRRLSMLQHYWDIVKKADYNTGYGVSVIISITIA